MNNNMIMKSKLETKELLLLESEVKNRGKSMMVSYLLWYFLGYFGGHRFYTGRKGSAIAMLVLSITVIGLIVTTVWWIVDAFLVHQWVKDQNQEVEAQILADIQSNKEFASV
jgi:TM2 domain-containing membrane protein YozV